jgi:hypothetical protein
MTPWQGIPVETTIWFGDWPEWRSSLVEWPPKRIKSFELGFLLLGLLLDTMNLHDASPRFSRGNYGLGRRLAGAAEGRELFGFPVRAIGI